MRARLKFSPFVHDFVLTTATSLGTIFCLLFLTRLIARNYGPDDLGLYVMFRRVGAFLVPVSTLMIGVGMTRELAMKPASPPMVVSGSTVIAAVGTSLTVTALIAMRLAEPIVELAQSSFLPILTPLIIFLCANLVYTVVYSWNRGTGRMQRANLWQILCVALVPLAVVLAGTNRLTISEVLIAIAAAYGLPILDFLRIQPRLTGQRTGALKAQITALARFCLPRVPGSLGLTGILALAPVAAAADHGLRGSGLLGAGQSVFAIAEAGATALGLLLLPKVAALVAANRPDELRNRVSELVLMTVQVGLPLSVALVLFSREIIELWLGSEYLAAIIPLRIYSMALFPYVAYVTLRSILDAVERRALNTISILVALGVQVIAIATARHYGHDLRIYALATALALAMLGVMSLYFVWRHGLVNMSIADLRPVLPGVLLVAGPLALVSLFTDPNAGLGARATLKLVGGAIGCAGYAAVLVRMNPNWVRALRTRIVLT